MHLLYSTVRFFPYWALPLVLVLVELGIHFRHRNRMGRKWVSWGSAGLLLMVICIWFYFQGTTHSDAWIKSFLNSLE